MAKPPKYTNVTVSKQVYVSSHFDYFVDVTFTVDGRRRGKKSFDMRDGWFLGERLGQWDAPQYVRREVGKQLIAVLRDPETRYYEYDRDGNKRYENLRYWDAESVAQMADWFSKDAAYA